MGATPVASSNRKYLHYAVGAVAALVLVYVSSMSYFRASESRAVTVPPPPVQYEAYGYPTVVCGSPDPLLSAVTTPKPYNIKFSYGGRAGTGSTQQIVNCRATNGGETKYIALRRSTDAKVKIIYRIKIDGSATPLIELESSNESNPDTLTSVGWTFGKNLITTTVPIKFNSSLVIEAVAQADPTTNSSTLSIAGHVMFDPLTNEDALPVKFLKPQEVKFETTPTVNIGNSPTIYVGGQPIHTVTP